MIYVEQIANNNKRFTVKLMFVSDCEQDGEMKTKEVFAKTPAEAAHKCIKETSKTILPLKHIDVYEMVRVGVL